MIANANSEIEQTTKNRCNAKIPEIDFTIYNIRLNDCNNGLPFIETNIFMTATMRQVKSILWEMDARQGENSYKLPVYVSEADTEKTYSIVDRSAMLGSLSKMVLYEKDGEIKTDDSDLKIALGHYTESDIKHKLVDDGII